MHRSRLGQLMIDVAEADHDRTLAFWTEATGAKAQQGRKYPEYHVLESPGLPIATFVQRHGGTSRYHLDIETDDVAAEVARLSALGADKLDFIDDWQVMRDPAGLLFCVVPVDAADLTDDNSTAWP
jgi:hypothetical protein